MVCTALIVAGASACSSKSGGSPLATASTLNPANTSYHGVIPDPIRDRPDFQLVDTAGKAVSFLKDTSGTATLLYFGYTHCPDECPTTLHDLHAALTLVPAEVRSKIKVYFVTTDPRRDTPAVLSHYLAQFDTTFIGLTGSLQQIAAAEDAANVPLAEPDTAAPLPNGAGYSVNHAAVVLAYDTANRNPVLYPSGTTVETYATDFPLLAKESS